MTTYYIYTIIFMSVGIAIMSFIAAYIDHHSAQTNKRAKSKRNH